MAYLRLSPLAKRIFKVFISSCVILGASAVSIKASSICIANADASSMSGQTCHIGPLTFYFGTFQSYGTDETFRFDPLSNGFSLTSNAHAIESTGSSGGSEYAYLNYAVIDYNGVISGIGVSGGTQTTVGIYSARSQYYNEICNAAAKCASDQFLTYDRHPTTEYKDQSGLGYSAYPSAIAEAFQLDSQAGATAAWDGAPTNFTFDVSATPEPSTMLLFGTGLIALVKVTRRKLSE